MKALDKSAFILYYENIVKLLLVFTERKRRNSFMKKFYKLILSVLLIFTLTACKDKGKDPGKDKEDPGSKAGETYEIGVAIYQFDDNFMTAYREELQKHFKEVGSKDGNTYNLDIQDGKKDQSTQTEQINNFIAQGKDLIIANMVDTTAAESIINDAKAADIPIIFINREPDPEIMKIWPGKTTYIGSDATTSGTIQGEMIANLDDKGDANGDGVLNYIILQGDPANVDAQQRTEYSIKVLKDKNIEHNALSEPYQADWDSALGQEFTANALEQFGEKLDVIFSNNDGMAMGAITAIEASGRKINEDIYLVGVDAIPDAIEALKDGNLTGTVLNDHFNQAHTVIEVAQKLLANEDVSSYYWHEYVAVQKPEDAELERSSYKEETVDEVIARYAER